MPRSRFDIVSLVVGLFFLGVAVIWGLAGRNVLTSGSWALPGLLVAVGLVGLVAAMITGAFRRREDG